MSRFRTLTRDGAGRRLAAGGSALAVLTASLVAVLTTGGGSSAAAVPVDVFPIPGGHVASPSTQIVFRGVPVGQIGTVTVTGSVSGPHTGHLAGDSDGDGGSFLPDQPFKPGEVVTVQTALNIAGSTNGTFSFTVATPAPRIPGSTRQRAPRTAHDVMSFASRPDLKPAAVDITKLPTRRAAPGAIFLGPQAGPLQYGPMILGPDGGLIYFQPLPRNDTATDVRVQTYDGQPVLTWWQGNVSHAGTGAGVDEIYNTSYRQVARIVAGNGLSADLHEFQITPQNTALITAYYPVYWDARSVRGGTRRALVLDSVVQEIDIPTGLVLFQWDSLDHVPVNYTYAAFPHPSNHPFDYFHINSVQPLPGGAILISSRNTWAAYEVSGANGSTIWELGGRHSSFRMGPNTSFVFQHDVRLRAADQVTIFDDGAGPPAVHKQSRALTLALDTTKMTATLAAQALHRPGLLAFYEGNVQRLGNGDDFVGWGQQPYFTEFNSRGQAVFDGRFVGANSSYRAYRSAWTGTPVTYPAVAARRRGATTTVYASWNGSTLVNQWRVLTGSSPSALKPARRARKTSFETAIGIAHAGAYVAAQALDVHARVLATSRPVRVR